MAMRKPKQHETMRAAAKRRKRARVIAEPMPQIIGRTSQQGTTRKGWDEDITAQKALDALMIQKALNESRIEVIAIRNRRLVAKLQADFSLGGGEAEPIALALNEKAQLLGIDDKNGINACKLLGIAFTTAVGIFIRSREKGLLEGPDALAKLRLLAKRGRYKNSIN